MKILNLSKLTFNKNKKELIIIVKKPTENITSVTKLEIDKIEIISK